MIYDKSSTRAHLRPNFNLDGTKPHKNCAIFKIKISKKQKDKNQNMSTKVKLSLKWDYKL